MSWFRAIVLFVLGLVCLAGIITFLEGTYGYLTTVLTAYTMSSDTFASKLHDYIALGGQGLLWAIIGGFAFYIVRAMRSSHH